MEKKKRVGILTGGGDVPGLNPAIKAAVEMALTSGWEVLGIRLGWGGLLHYNLDNPQARHKQCIPLTMNSVRIIDRTGGTFLHTSRTNPQRVKASDLPDFLEGVAEPIEGEGNTALYDHTPHVLKVIDALELDALIAIGGDDTLSYAARLHHEGFPVVAIPKTMDNDVYGTDYCIGFSTAVTRSVEAITALRTTSGSHERIAVVELFGRNSGETSLFAAYLADVDRAIISEVPFDMHKLALLLVQDKYANPSNYAIMTISEGATEVGGDIIQDEGDVDAYGHRKLGGIGETTVDKLKDDHQRECPLPETELPDAQRCPRLARPHGGCQLWPVGDGLGARRTIGAHGSPARWHVHARAAEPRDRGRQARGRRRNVRRRAVPPPHRPCTGQADVPLLGIFSKTRGGGGVGGRHSRPPTPRPPDY